MKTKSLGKLKKSFILMCSLGACHFSYALPNNNPFLDASFYVDPDYAAKTEHFFENFPQMLPTAKKLGLINDKGQWSISTAVWLDRKAAITDSDHAHGVYWHLEDAYAKANGPTAVTFVVYDLPARDCAAYSSNGEIKITKDASGKPDVKAALDDYKNNYIDPIKSELARFFKDHPDAVENLRVVLVIEPDSLPNMITNTTMDKNYPNSCKFVAENHVYERGIRYALKTFADSGDLPLYMYLDIAHSGWLGWKSNTNLIYTVYNSNGQSIDDNVAGLGEGYNSVRGLITNTANYTPLQENFGTKIYNDNNKGLHFSAANYQYYSEYNNHIMDNNFFEWNDTFDETTYIAELLSLDNSSQPKLHFYADHDHRIMPVENGYFKNMHFLVDTSRNNWKADNGNYNLGFEHVDQRSHRGNWCNIEDITLPNGKDVGAGMGVRPVADPLVNNPLISTPTQLPIDAYVWIKPPGESDGNYDPSAGTGDLMCGVESVIRPPKNYYAATDALQIGKSPLAPAPAAGNFFPEAFTKLILNAAD